MRTRDTDKQQRIKDAMIKLILTEGIEGASVSKIAHAAGVSPATIYVYYDSKEAMLAEVFREYAHASYAYLQDRVRPDMDAAELIEAVARGYYAFAVENEAIFSFVEQASHCPTLANQVCDENCCCEVFALFHERQNAGQMRRVSDAVLVAVLFAPVRYLVLNRSRLEPDAETYLDELVSMLKVALAN